MLDERSLAKEDESAVFLPRREAFRRGLAALEAGDTAAAKLAFAEADEQGSPNAAYNYASLCLADGDNDAGLAALRRASRNVTTQPHRPTLASTCSETATRKKPSSSSAGQTLRIPRAVRFPPTSSR